MRSISLLIPALLGITLSTNAQQAVLKGTVKTDTGEQLPFANVSIPGSKTGVVASKTGAFILTLAKAGTYKIKVTSVGYKGTEQTVTLLPNDTTHQEITLSSNGDLQEFVVSASRKQETLDQVPSSITILGAKDLAIQKGISNNISDILANSVPGLGFASNTTGNSGQTLRGREILVMIDGIPQSTPLRNGGRDIRSIDPSAIERVEVIKGATAIYGNGADGGLINYITKKATPGQPLSGQTTLGANTQLKNAQHTGGWQVGQLLSGSYKKLDYVVSGHYEQTGVYKDAKGVVLSPDYGLGETQLWNAYTKIGYSINSNNRVEVMYNFFGSQQRSDYILKKGHYRDTAATGVFGTRPGDPEGTPYNHNVNVHYGSQKIIGNTDLDINVYYQKFYTVFSWVDSFVGGGQSTISSDKKGVRINLSTPFRTGKNIEGDLVYGLDLLTDKTAQKLTDGRTWVPEMSMRNLAPYAQLKTTFFKHLILKAGARYENINVDVPDYTTIISLNTKTGLYSEGGKSVKGGAIDYNALVFNAGLRYNELKYFKPFISYSQSFSVNELGRTLRTASESTVSLLKTKAIVANNYEAGFNSSLGPVELEGAYYISTSKLGANYTLVEGRFEIAREPIKIHGFEIAADVRILKNLGAGASYSYIEGKIDANKNGQYNDKEDAYILGDKIAPPKLTAYIRYQPVKQWNLRIQMLQAGARNRFAPDANGAYTYGKGPIQQFTLFSLFSDFNIDGHSSVQVGVDNLFNKDYYTVTSQWNARNENFIKGSGTRVNITYNYKF
ncbi:TonB-dependent receptor [Chitinophaga sp.]|uniref:TonB-dependent receptor n=1 Tax=Chitinophaga sp. TaxID=1869181 RepID=UPI002F943034